MPETPIKDSLDELMKKIPSTGRGFSETVLTTNGFRSEVGHRINNGWSASAFVGSKWGAKPEAGILLRGKW